MTTLKNTVLVLLCVAIWLAMFLAFDAYSLTKERNAIIKAHCDVIDTSTGTFKCANGKVYLLGAKE